MAKQTMVKKQKELIKLEMQRFMTNQNLENGERNYSTLENYV